MRLAKRDTIPQPLDIKSALYTHTSYRRVSNSGMVRNAYITFPNTVRSIQRYFFLLIFVLRLNYTEYVDYACY
jgi:hypothetical protein